MLKRHVKDGHVNYQGFKSDEARLDKYLKVLENTDIERLSPSEQFAFYANAYNAWTIKLILSGYPGIKSIKDLGSLLKTPWKKKIVRIDGKLLTLDDVEHNPIRVKYLTGSWMMPPGHSSIILKETILRAIRSMCQRYLNGLPKILTMTWWDSCQSLQITNLSKS